MQSNSDAMPKIGLVMSMIIFGTIGVFRRYIPLESSVVALLRGFLGTVFVFVFMMLMKRHVDLGAVKKNLPLLILSGGFIGFNWILLFEAYNYTTVSVATICYYTAPVMVIAASPFLFRENFTVKKVICIALSLLGMVLVSGVWRDGFRLSDAKGIAYGLGAAVLYATVVVLNKFIKGISDFDKTIFQLLFATVVLAPYTLITASVCADDITAVSVIMILVVGVLNTAFSYTMYFSSIGRLKAQTVAILSYIDPAVAMILSAFVLREPVNLFSIVGAILILGSTLVCEL